MATVIGSVHVTNNSSKLSTPCHFTVETSVYNTSKAIPVQFFITCFLKNTKRWQKIKTPPSNTFLNITAKIADRIANTNHLAFRILDLTYLLKPTSAAAAPTLTATPPSIRSNRWKNRAAPSIPSKRPYVSDSVNDSTKLSNRDTTIPKTTQIEYNLFHIEDLIDSITLPTSLSTAT